MSRSAGEKVSLQDQPEDQIASGRNNAIKWYNLPVEVASASAFALGANGTLGKGGLP